MSEPVAFAIEGPDGLAFVVDGPTGWMALIAGYARFPEPRREREGWPVLVPAGDVSVDSLRAVLRSGFMSECVASVPVVPNERST